MSSGDAPPQPKAILRGHKVQVHAAVFIRRNRRLVTGDADGFVVVWDLTIMRPRAVWQAHDNAILGLSEWGLDKIITHGRDNKLIVWMLAEDGEAGMSTLLPLDPTADARPKPWMLYMLEVNTMNFCSFASCSVTPASSQDSELLIAVPNTLASEAVDIYHLPSQGRLHTIKLGDKNGMAMALALVWLADVLTLVAGYENGLAIVAQLDHDGSWNVQYRSQCHSQPILSLDVAPTLEYFVTSGADAIIAKHPLMPRTTPVAGLIEDSPGTTKSEFETRASSDDTKGKEHQDKPSSALSAALAGQSAETVPNTAKKRRIQTDAIKIVNTKHSGQQSVQLRSDGRVFATAGWDSKVRVYSAKTMREVAVLKWHSVGCFTVAFSTLDIAVLDGVQTISSGEAEPEQRLLPKMMEMTVKDRRVHQAKAAHWLAAGSKDGKISLWDIF